MKGAYGPRRQDDLQPAAELAQLTKSPDATSRQRHWDGVVVDLHKWKGPGRVAAHVTDHDLIAMRVSGVTPLCSGAMARRTGVWPRRET